MMEINIDGIETIVYHMESEGFSGEIIDESPDRFHGILQVKNENVGPVMLHKGCYLVALTEEDDIDDRFMMIDPDSDTTVIAMGPGAWMLRKAFEICGIGWRHADMKVNR